MRTSPICPAVSTVRAACSERAVRAECWSADLNGCFGAAHRTSLQLGAIAASANCPNTNVCSVRIADLYAKRSEGPVPALAAADEPIAQNHSLIFFSISLIAE